MGKVAGWADRLCRVASAPSVWMEVNGWMWLILSKAVSGHAD